MSTNIQESEAASRKRRHDEYSEDSVQLGKDASIGFEKSGAPKDVPPKDTVMKDASPVQCSPSPRQLSPVPIISLQSPPGSCSPAALTEAGSSTPTHNSHSPNRNPSKSPAYDLSGPSTVSTILAPPAQPSASSNPMTLSAIAPAAAPVKRVVKRKTPAEKAAEEREREEKRQKKQEEAAAKAQEKARLAAEKAAKDAEKAAEKAARDAARALKDAEKAEKAAKEAEKRRKIEEAERKQTKLFSFLKPQQSKPALTTPARSSTNQPNDSLAIGPTVSETDAGKPDQEPQTKQCEYDRLFKEFFVKPDVKLAPPPFEMDDKTKEVKSRILEEYIYKTREEFNPLPFDAIATFQLNGIPQERGMMHPSVSKIMKEIYGDPMPTTSGEQPTRTDSQSARFQSVQQRLANIPIKTLKFYEDVRPPYVGTVTSIMGQPLRKLARQPNGRLLKTVNYEYDSELEWEEEDGEDLDDCEDEDDENEGDEEMADFLDDAEEVAATRPTFLGDVQPVSTGLCFENRKRLGPCPKAYKYRMEFIWETLEHHSMIDPFSAEYWTPKVVLSKKTGDSTGQPSSMAPPTLNDAYAMLTSKVVNCAHPITPKDLVPADLLEDFKRAIIRDDISFLTKVGMVDMLSKRFSKCTKKQVTNTLENVAERISKPGGPKKEKVWALTQPLSQP